MLWYLGADQKQKKDFAFEASQEMYLLLACSVKLRFVAIGMSIFLEKSICLCIVLPPSWKLGSQWHLVRLLPYDTA